MVSIIIPCFNSGFFLLESIESCLNSSYKEIEIIVVNDGSTDAQTINILKFNLPSGVKIIHSENFGAAKARNIGVNSSKGEFLLFLDSDNRIKHDYIAKALNLMSQDDKIGVVYCQPYFFGSNIRSNKRFNVLPYNFNRLLAGNYIDMCSIVRRQAFLDVFGFDENNELYFGEDWDLWIRISDFGWGFKFIDEILFEYRVRDDSIMGQIDKFKLDKTLSYLGSKHGPLIHKHYRQFNRLMVKMEENPLTYFFKILYHKYIDKKPFIK